MFRPLVTFFSLTFIPEKRKTEKVECVKMRSCNFPYHQLSQILSYTYFDDFFTTPLIFKLKEYQTYSCGTVCQIRKGILKNLKKDEEMKRGELDRRQSEGMHLVKWMDAKGVIILSTIDSFMPVVPVR